MKKKYTKPQLFYESFSMAGSVASCDVNTTADDMACTYNSNGLIFFSSDNQACVFKPQEGGDYCSVSVPNAGLVLVGS